jgi:hypothetical protein
MPTIDFPNGIQGAKKLVQFHLTDHPETKQQFFDFYKQNTGQPFSRASNETSYQQWLLFVEQEQTQEATVQTVEEKPAVPIIDFPVDSDKGCKKLIFAALKEYPELADEFFDFYKANMGFTVNVSNDTAAKQQWLYFVESKKPQVEIVDEPQPLSSTVEDVIVPLQDDNTLVEHRLVFNGQDVRDQKVRQADHIDPEAYTNWLSEQPITEWLQSINKEFELQNPIPLDTPLLIKVDWLPKVVYNPADHPTLNNKNELRVSKKETLVIRGRAALNTNSRKSSSPLEYNATEKQEVFNQELFYLPYVPEHTAAKYTTEDGVDIDVTRIEMVLADKPVANHLWSFCSIQSYNPTTAKYTTHFLSRTEKPQHVEKQEPKYKVRNGFEGFQAQMFNGGYSDSFVALIHKLRPDGSLLTQNGKSVVQETVCRFRIAAIQHTKDTMQSTARGLSHADTGSQYNNSVDKTNRVWMDIRLKDGSWSSESILLGKAHFSSMGAVYKCEDYDSRVDNYKTVVRQKGKHILRLLADPLDKTREIQAACRAFSACDLRYQNGVLGSVNGRGDFNPMFRRIIDSYTPIVELQTNPDCLLLLKDYNEIVTRCHKWLQKNHAEWLQLETPKTKKSGVKQNRNKYTVEDHIKFMAKQTVRCGSPVFCDSKNLQPVSLPVIYEYLKGIVIGSLGDATKQTWLELRHVLLRLYTQKLVSDETWECLTPNQQKDMLKRTNPTFKVEEVQDLFNPARLGLMVDNQPHPTWFRLLESFYKAFDIEIKYTEA